MIGRWINLLILWASALVVAKSFGYTPEHTTSLVTNFILIAIFLKLPHPNEDTKGE